MVNGYHVEERVAAKWKLGQCWEDRGVPERKKELYYMKLIPPTWLIAKVLAEQCPINNHGTDLLLQTTLRSDLPLGHATRGGQPSIDRPSAPEGPSHIYLSSSSTLRQWTNFFRDLLILPSRIQDFTTQFYALRQWTNISCRKPASTQETPTFGQSLKQKTGGVLFRESISPTT
ncbi:hypothetical protein SAY87_005595 [Trapa incisa]|uniref:Uncharacterized protein n=1 Tax=Trapa incisa TaxID=236973 RepID=A0AAN7KB77_9MYRT|nr:hypothetical protein SAY87_005595 [Trapa incisa]